MREGSNTTVVSDSVDDLEMRTVPESASPSNGPRARVLLEHMHGDDLSHLVSTCCYCWISVSPSRETKAGGKRTLTRRGRKPTAILRTAFGRFFCEGARSRANRTSISERIHHRASGTRTDGA